MTKKRWFRFYIDPWFKGTFGLSPNEIAAYVTILCELYDNDGIAALDIPIMARRCGMRQTSFRTAVDGLIGRRKVFLEAGLLTSKAVGEEIISREKLRQKSAETRTKRAEISNENKPNPEKSAPYIEYRIENKKERDGEVVALPPALPPLAVGAAEDRAERSKRALEEFEKRRAERPTNRPTFLKNGRTH